MKAAPFAYTCPEHLDEALDLLAEHGTDAKLMAGGQSLVPMMVMRLARPEVLIDINRLNALKTVEITASGVRTGSAVRQKDIEQHEALLRALPLVGAALPWVGHQQIRSRGTVGGSLVHADPSAELPLALLVNGGSLHLRSRQRGTRSVLVDEFFLGPMFTAVEADECLTDIHWSHWAGAPVGAAFEETSIRHGDFAMASAACQVQFDDQGRIHRLAFGVGGVGSTPMTFPALADTCIGQTMSAERARDLAHAAGALLDPQSDVHVQPPFRRHLATSLLERALLRASDLAVNHAD